MYAKQDEIPTLPLECDCCPKNLEYALLANNGFLSDERFFSEFLASHLNVVFGAFFTKISDGIFILDNQFRYVCVNEKFLQITGLPKDQILGSYFSFYDIDRFPSYQQQLFRQLEERLIAKESINNDTFIIPHLDGLEVVSQLQVSPYQIGKDNFIFNGVVTDLTEKSTLRQDALSALNFDELTGLQCYDAFFDKLKATIRLQAKTPAAITNQCMVLRINIDKLQSFNQSLGIESTNKLIQSFVNRIKLLQVGGCYLIAFSRFGGDNFALLVNVDGIGSGYQYLEQLSQLFELPLVINEQYIYVRFSLGISVLPTDSMDAETLLLQADTALKQARLSGGDDIVWYKNSQKNTLFQNIHLSSAFKNALAKQQIVPYFQPKLGFNTPNTPMFEALARWEHPTLGLLYPKDFLEEVLDQFSQPLFECLIHACIAQIQMWQQQLGLDCHVCINVDSRQLTNHKFIEFIESTLAQYPWLPRLVQFEITEIFSLQDEVKTTEILLKLHAAGFCIYLDDFGTGFSALQYLIKYPIDRIKIDRLFINNILTDKKRQTIVQSITEMAHRLSIGVLAEGVDSQAEIEYLQQLGCDYVQGYGFSKPMPSQQTTQWLMQRFTQV